MSRTSMPHGGPPRLSRRDWLRLCAAGVGGISFSGWLEHLAHAAADGTPPKRSCILLWMNGGPSQIDTFDLKPGHANGGMFKEIETSVPGLRISEHFPKLAKQAQHLALVRSMSTKEGDHGRASYLLRTGYLPQGPIRYPALGALLAKELGAPGAELPNFVAIAPYRQFNPAAYESGFLGSQYAPLVVGDTRTPLAQPAAEGDDYGLVVDDLAPATPVSAKRVDARLKILGDLEKPFVDRHRATQVASTAAPAHAALPALSHRAAQDRAVRLMQSEARQAFELDREPAPLRDAYGRNRFGQGCLMARRLVERGVPFVEVTLSGVAGQQAFGWDTHADNFDTVRRLSEVLDAAWATLLQDLSDRGLLKNTLVVWMGEFGRTPQINQAGGRDHFPQAWSTVLSGGGMHAGQIIGRTSADGMTVEDRPVSVPDLLATVCRAVGVDPMLQNASNVGRPIRVVDPDAKAIEELLA